MKHCSEYPLPECWKDYDTAYLVICINDKRERWNDLMFKSLESAIRRCEFLQTDKTTCIVSRKIIFT